MGQNTELLPVITIDNNELDVVLQFAYLGSIITNSLSSDKELDKKVAKTATTVARLTPRVWAKSRLTVNTKIAVYDACIASTLLYGRESWATYAKHKTN